MTWLFGNYGRLSKDEKGEKADSRETQLNFNAEYIKDNRLGVIVGNYFDDDVSGSVFEREDLDRLKEDIVGARINAIVVKDLSRLGRSNAKTLTLIEYLEEKNVRLIAINDNYDSLKDNDDLIGIKTWYNERYIKDISVKIRSNVHQKLKEGEYLGTPPFGYKKDYQVINNKLKSINKLVADEIIRPVIIEIFDLYIKGHGYRSIADLMQDKGYPNPSQYKNYNRPQSERWTGDHIKRIIKNRVYCGDTVQGTSERISYKSKKTRRRPEATWYNRENTHEPIVSRETWELANEINKKRANQNGVRNKKTIYLFSGFLQCGACGKHLCARKVKNKSLGYICSSYFHFGKKRIGKSEGCESHYVRDDLLAEIVYQDLLKQIGLKDIVSAINDFRENQLMKRDFAKRVDSCQKEIKKYQQQLNIAYEDRLNNVISVSLYQMKTKDINKRIDYLKMQMSKLETEILQNQRMLNSKSELKPIFDNYVQNNRLTRELLERAVKKIYVFMPGDINEVNKLAVMLMLGASLETVEYLCREGGIFIEYNFRPNQNW